MDRSTWRTTGLLLLVAGVVLAAVGASDWGACINSRQNLLFEGSPDSDGWEPIAAIYDELDEIPKSAWDRAKLVAPTCDIDAPLSANYEWYLIAMLCVLASFVCFGGSREPKPKKESIQRPKRKRPVVETQKQQAAIDVEKRIEISFGEVSETERERDSQTLMAFVEERRVEQSETSLEETSAPRLDGFYVPPGYDNKPILYVDHAAHDVETDENTARFNDLSAALAHAQRMVLRGTKGVQIRVAPGLYQTSIEIPSNVVVINQRLPDGGDSKSRLQWMMQQELDDPDRVTILADPKAAYGVRFGPGSKHGLFGCFVIGRQAVKQAGIALERAESVAIVNCIIEGFTQSGIRAVKVGSELPGLGLVVNGTMIRGNSSQEGGGIFCDESSITIESSVLSGNRARIGGGLFLRHARHPAMIRGTRFSDNRAQLADNPSDDPMKLPLQNWGLAVGMGGGAYIASSHAKLVDVEFVTNGASVAGGALATLGSKTLIQNQEHRSRFKGNRARIGGAIASIGWPGHDGSLKLQETSLKENDAVASGGAVAVIGHNIVQAIDCDISENRATGPQGVGGGISCHIGGRLDAQAGSISDNESVAHGGGIASINARLRLGGQVEVHNNRSGGSGGGVFMITEPCKVTEALIAHQHFDLPVRLIIDDATVRYNKCAQTGSGLRVGNLGAQPTLPIGIKVHQASVRSNSSTSETTDVFVTWAGKVVTTDVHALKKNLLK